MYYGKRTMTTFTYSIKLVLEHPNQDTYSNPKVFGFPGMLPEELRKRNDPEKHQEPLSVDPNSAEYKEWLLGKNFFDPKQGESIEFLRLKQWAHSDEFLECPVDPVEDTLRIICRCAKERRMKAIKALPRIPCEPPTILFPCLLKYNPTPHMSFWLVNDSNTIPISINKSTHCKLDELYQSQVLDRRDQTIIYNRIVRDSKCLNHRRNSTKTMSKSRRKISTQV